MNTKHKQHPHSWCTESREYAGAWSEKLCPRRPRLVGTHVHPACRWRRGAHRRDVPVHGLRGGREEDVEVCELCLCSGRQRAQTTRTADQTQQTQAQQSERNSDEEKPGTRERRAKRTQTILKMQPQKKKCQTHPAKKGNDAQRTADISPPRTGVRRSLCAKPVHSPSEASLQPARGPSEACPRLQAPATPSTPIHTSSEHTPAALRGQGLSGSGRSGRRSVSADSAPPRSSPNGTRTWQENDGRGQYTGSRFHVRLPLGSSHPTTAPPALCHA